MPSGEQGVVDLARAVRDVYEAAGDALLGVVAAQLRADLDESERRDGPWAPIDARAAATGVLRVSQQAARIVNRLAREGTDAAAWAVNEAEQRGHREADLEIGALLRRQRDDYARQVPHAVLGAFARNLADLLVPVHTSSLRQTVDVYREVVAAVMPAKLVGTQTRRRDVAAAAFRKFLDRGVTGFTDRSGRDWELASYVEMAVRTSGARAMVAGHMDRLETAGIDLVIVSDHRQECPLCRPWEGRVLHRVTGGAGPVQVKSMTGPELVTVHVAGSLAEARAAGFQHPNCAHSVSAYLPGATRTPQEKGRDTEDAQGWRDRDRLRALERHVRHWKRRELGALDETDRAYAHQKVVAWQTALREHVKATGLVRQTHREKPTGPR